MKIFQNIGGTVVFGVVAAIAVVGGFAPQTYAQEGKDHKSTEAKATVKSDSKKSDKKMYSYTANAGDSYTQLVRKAVQTYGIVNKEDLGEARIVAAETIASYQAGLPSLNEGQVVSFSESTVKDWVDHVKTLSAEDVAAWQTYVPYINFDTRGIGE